MANDVEVGGQDANVRTPPADQKGQTFAAEEDKSPNFGSALKDWTLSFVDPTRRLSSAPSEHMLDFSDEVIARWRTGWKERPLQIFSCADQRVRYSVVHALRALQPELDAREIMFGTFSTREHQLTM